MRKIFIIMTVVAVVALGARAQQSAELAALQQQLNELSAKIAQLEKANVPGKDKKLMKTIVASITRKPEGKLTIAPGSDARDAVDPVSVAAADFANDEEEFVE